MKAILDTPDEFFSSTSTYTEKDRGRLIVRDLKIGTAYKNEFGFPHVAQYAVLTQHTEFPAAKKKSRHETFAIITSASPQKCSPEQLLQCFRWEWTIENKSHYVRDVTLSEDRSRIRSGNAPRAMATFRNLAIGTMRLLGFANIAQAVRQFNYRPDSLFNGFGLKVSSPFGH
jgi:predicted transposase YbfD/YdcC